RQVWASGDKPDQSFPSMADGTGGGALHWPVADRLVIAGEQDGWQHLYALNPQPGAAPQLLTPGNCEVEQWSFTPNGKSVLFNSNCGDVDRRHPWQVGLSGSAPRQVTMGEGIEWSPIALSDGKSLAFIGSDARRPSRPMLASDGAPQPLAAETWPKDFPSDQLVVPQSVTFRAADGLEIHGQLFLPKNL